MLDRCVVVQASRQTRTMSPRDAKKLRKDKFNDDTENADTWKVTKKKEKSPRQHFGQVDCNSIV